MAKKDDKRSPDVAPQAPPSPDVAPTMAGFMDQSLLFYGDLSRMLLRVHRNVDAHMEAHKRLVERMQAVFAHEQAMALELARLIDGSLAPGTRPASEAGRPPLGPDNIERIFDHATNAVQETGKMLTDIQLESLSLLRQYMSGTPDDDKK